jgi:Ecdysteroid kinase-like family
LIERFGPNTPLLLDRLASMPATVAHFDYRLDNLFFGANEVVKMIDFQTSSKGGFAYDLGYLLSQSMRIEDRRTHETDLLRTYHDALVASGVGGYSFDQLRADYRVGVLYGWIIPVFAVGSLDVSSDRAMALWTEVLARVQSAMSDHEVHSLLTV